MTTCPTCGGSGRRFNPHCDTDIATGVCFTCGGTGSTEAPEPTQPCAWCEGEGCIRDKDGKLGEDCPRCKGRSRLDTERGGNSAGTGAGESDQSPPAPSLSAEAPEESKGDLAGSWTRITCPTCGSVVRAVHGDEGTSFFSPEETNTEGKLTPEERRVIEEARDVLRGDLSAVDAWRDAELSEAVADKLDGLLENNPVTEAPGGEDKILIVEAQDHYAELTTKAERQAWYLGCAHGYRQARLDREAQPPQEAPREWTLYICPDCGFVATQRSPTARCLCWGTDTPNGYRDDLEVVRVAELPPEEGA